MRPEPVWSRLKCSHGAIRKQQCWSKYRSIMCSSPTLRLTSEKECLACWPTCIIPTIRQGNTQCTLYLTHQIGCHSCFCQMHGLMKQELDRAATVVVIDAWLTWRWLQSWDFSNSEKLDLGTRGKMKWFAFCKRHLLIAQTLFQLFCLCCFHVLRRLQE